MIDADQAGKAQTMDVATACDTFICGLLGVASVQNRSELRGAELFPVVHFDYEWHAERRVADEFIVREHEPAAVLATIAAYAPMPDHIITLIGRPAAEQPAYERAGYRLAATEYLMARSVANLPPVDGRYHVELARTLEQMQWLNDHDPAGYAWITPVNLSEPRLRHYFVTLDQRPVSRACAFSCDAAHSYTWQVYTAETHRRRGLAQAVMMHLLTEAAAHGHDWNVLLASESGLPLYHTCGYEQLSTVLVFKPHITGAI